MVSPEGEVEWPMLTRKTIALCLWFAGLPAFAQTSGKLRKENPPIPVSDIIQKFAENEAQFKIAHCNYSFRLDFRVQNLAACRT